MSCLCKLIMGNTTLLGVTFGKNVVLTRGISSCKNEKLFLMVFTLQDYTQKIPDLWPSSPGVPVTYPSMVNVVSSRNKRQMHNAFDKLNLLD